MNSSSDTRQRDASMSDKQKMLILEKEIEHLNMRIKQQNEIIVKLRDDAYNTSTIHGCTIMHPYIYNPYI
jgi:hypothetical protein